MSTSSINNTESVALWLAVSKSSPQAIKTLNQTERKTVKKAIENMEAQSKTFKNEGISQEVQTIINKLKAMPSVSDAPKTSVSDASKKGIFARRKKKILQALGFHVSAKDIKSKIVEVSTQPIKLEENIKNLEKTKSDITTTFNSIKKQKELINQLEKEIKTYQTKKPQGPLVEITETLRKEYISDLKNKIKGLKQTIYNDNSKLIKLKHHKKVLINKIKSEETKIIHTIPKSNISSKESQSNTNISLTNNDRHNRQVRELKNTLQGLNKFKQDLIEERRNIKYETTDPEEKKFLEEYEQFLEETNRYIEETETRIRDIEQQSQETRQGLSSAQNFNEEEFLEPQEASYSTSSLESSNFESIGELPGSNQQSVNPDDSPPISDSTGKPWQ